MQAGKMVLLAMIVGGLALGGCTSSKDLTRAVDQRMEEPAAPAAETSPAAPDFKEQRLADALRGLSYGSGLVEIDQAAAAEVIAADGGRTAEDCYQQGQEMIQVVNDRVAAIKAFTRAVILAPDVPRYYESLGRALRNKGLSDRALAAFRTALELDPDYLDARCQLAVTLQMSGEQEQAIAAWQRVLELDPARGEAHQRLAVLFYYNEAFGDAWSHVHRAEALDHPVPAQFRSLLGEKMPEPVQ